MRDRIYEAIRGRFEIEFEYEGHRRVVIPSAVALNESTGVEMLWGRQVGGSCRDDLGLPQKMLFDLQKIENLVEASSSEAAPPNVVDSGESGIDEIWGQV